MNRLLHALLVLVAVFALSGIAPAGSDDGLLHHDLKVRLAPSEHRIEVEDTISFPEGSVGFELGPQGGLVFRLNAGLEVTSGTPDFAISPIADDGAGERDATGSEEEAGGRLRVRLYEANFVGKSWTADTTLVLNYSGTIHHPPVSEGEEYAQSFGRTPGTIQPNGVMLSGASWWVPWFENWMMTFRLDVDLPAEWDVVSQGERKTHALKDGRRSVAWACPDPMEEVYLVANRFTTYERSAGNVQAYVYLRTPDETLAAKYLEVTAQYVEMYRQLIGPYPFEKFAAVENFWETGYGMPSFTLLGPKVIRFPFILHSSYPHEILHNWWGNSVYVDWESGNWCEGLTVYLADHLIREGQGRGTEYRRETLKRYRSYVRGERDFPLTEFRSRHSGATQAVGYGKSMMLYHMLRVRGGDQAFTKAIQTLNRRFRFREASFSDLEAIFSEIYEEDLKPFFAQWVERAGAPILLLTVEQNPRGAERLTLIQTQDGEPYELLVPVAITVQGEGGPETRCSQIHMDGKMAHIPLPSGVLRVDVDPEFDVFRRLDRREIPPTISDLFGADKVLLVVPKEGADPMAGAWRHFASLWQKSGGGQVTVMAEDEIEALPADRAVWVLGSKNAWRYKLGLPSTGPEGGEFAIVGRDTLPVANHSFVYTARHPGNPELSVGWLWGTVEEALAGLARKLPHYGKYSYLAFEGTAPDNVVKGQWETTDSPLTQVFETGTKSDALPRRLPLARLAPVFDPARLIEHVRFLASDEMKGRGVGTPEIDRAADYIAASLEKAGLEPGGDDGTWLQTWPEANGPDGESVTLRNVVGMIRGTKHDELAPVVLGAHYDHLGLGWPDVRAGNEGKIHNGADDNASGVAVLLEVAGLLGSGHKPKRTIVFVAFSGEEWGLRGSRHFVKALGEKASERVFAMINLDTVGTLGKEKLQVFGAGTATEWRHIAMGIGFTTGVESVSIAEDPAGSDQRSFHDAGIPAVQIFTGATEDYHRPTDDVEKVDADGLVKVATFVREALVYLGERLEPLTTTLRPAGDRPKPPGPPTARRASFGVMPAFDYPGPGVRVGMVMEGSPAQEAGIQKGDLLLAINGEALDNLRAMSTVLKKHAPGDVVTVRFRRGDEEQLVEATLVAR